MKYIHSALFDVFFPQRYKVSHTLPVNPFPEAAAATAQPPSASSSSSAAAAAAAACAVEAQQYDDDVWVLPYPEQIIKRALPPPPIPAATSTSSAYCTAPSCTKKAR